MHAHNNNNNAVAATHFLPLKSLHAIIRFSMSFSAFCAFFWHQNENEYFGCLYMWNFNDFNNSSRAHSRALNDNNKSLSIGRNAKIICKTTQASQDMDGDWRVSASETLISIWGTIFMFSLFFILIPSKHNVHASFIHIFDKIIITLTVIIIIVLKEHHRKRICVSSEGMRERERRTHITQIIMGNNIKIKYTTQTALPLACENQFFSYKRCEKLLYFMQNNKNNNNFWKHQQMKVKRF